jgi:predicted RNase H-like nuclease (RuvC/YqgF family)
MQDLQLNGTLAANNITYTANGNTADFVFEDNYQLKDLSEVEAFIKSNKHLPEVPSAAEMEEAGVNLAEMNKLLLMKVEELTLYAIEQKAEVERLKAEVGKVRSSESEVRKEIEKMTEDRRQETEELEERLAKMEALIEKLSNR